MRVHFRGVAFAREQHNSGFKSHCPWAPSETESLGEVKRLPSYKKISSSFCSMFLVGTGMALGSRVLPNFTGELVLSLNHKLYLLQIIADMAYT